MWHQKEMYKINVLTENIGKDSISKMGKFGIPKHGHQLDILTFNF
jgi:hypothetical protein